MIRSLAVLSMVGAVSAAGAGSAATLPIILSVANAAASVWDTDPSKAGIELQIVNNGGAIAAGVRVTSVDVRGGSLAAATALPIGLGNIAPRGSALLDLVITVPRTDTTGYRLTISGIYRHARRAQRFSLTRAITPSAAPPGPIRARNGASATAPNQPASPAGPPAVGGPPGFGPNATTPMLIPPGPPRGPSLTNPDEAGPATQQRR
jgi:hypothetical protein